MRRASNFDIIFFRSILGISVLVLLIAAGLYAYLGTFSRYGGDDYCEAAQIRTSSPLAAAFNRYFSEYWPRATMPTFCWPVKIETASDTALGK